MRVNFFFQIWVTLDLMRYCTQICFEICDFLHIELFRIPYPGGPQKTFFTQTAEKNGTNSKITTRTIKTRSKTKQHH